MRIRLLTLLGAGLLLGAAALADAAALPLEHVPLVWKPTGTLQSLTFDGFDAAVKIETFRDVRPDKEKIGENIEDPTPRLVTTTDDVGVFVSRHVRDLLVRAGIRNVERDSAVIVRGEVRQFFVEETDHYNSAVILQLTVVDRKGVKLWSGLATGAARHFGHSYKLENYYEGLSDATVEAVKSMLHNPGLQRALSTH